MNFIIGELYWVQHHSSQGSTWKRSVESVRNIQPCGSQAYKIWPTILWMHTYMKWDAKRFWGGLVKYSLNNLNSKIIWKSKHLYYSLLHELVFRKNDLGVTLLWGLRNKLNTKVGSGHKREATQKKKRNKALRQPKQHP